MVVVLPGGLMWRFINRTEAGRELATMMRGFQNRNDVIVLGLPRGGVPVAFEVAKALRAPLDVLTVRKLGAPDNQEYALGAISTGGVTAVDWTLAERLGVSDAVMGEIIAIERDELERRERLYRWHCQERAQDIDFVGRVSHELPH